MEFQIPQDGNYPLSTIAFFYSQSKSKAKYGKGSVQKPTLKLADGKTIEGDVEVALYFASTFNIPVYPEALRDEINQWVSETSINFGDLEKYLTFRTYLVGHSLTLADIAVWGRILKAGMPHIQRFKATVEAVPMVKRYLSQSTPKETKAKAVDNTKFVTRFAPEPSGFLHIGHSKAALLAASFAHDHHGTFILRFDDTNPEIESKAFEDMIRSDFALLGLKADREEHTSDYFDKIFKTVDMMLEKGLAYADDSTKAEITKQREQLLPSPNRDNSVEKNKAMWAEMQSGSEAGTKICLRAKIDYKSVNGALRDPAIFRCKMVDGKPRCFPTYDLACPIVDDAAGVTHAMRSAEYTDRDVQYKWFLENLGLRKIEIVSFSRLSFKYTCLGKRYLRALVKAGVAKGWDEPNFPTFRGIARRGMTSQALQTFCREQGCAKNQNLHDWDKIWALNRQIVSKDCPRVMNVSPETHVICNVAGATEGTIDVLVHPKKPNMGKHTVAVGPKVWIEKFDAEQLKVGQKVSLLHWSNAIVDAVEADHVDVHLIDDNKYTDTYFMNWIVPEKGVSVIMREWKHLLSVEVLDTSKDLFEQVNKPPYVDTEVICDPSILDIKKGQICQLERRAEIICDEEKDAETGKPMFFLIPTGSSTPMGIPIKVQLFVSSAQAMAEAKAK